MSTNIPQPLKPALTFEQQIERLKKVHNLTIANEDFLSDLYETDKAAQSMYESLCSDMEKKENVNEVLKARDPVTWVRKKNAIAYQAEEIVRKEVVYV